MHLKPLSNGCVARRGAANVFIACHTFTRGSDGTKESRRGLPLLWEDRRLCNPAHGRRARRRRHGGDSRAHVDEHELEWVRAGEERSPEGDEEEPPDDRLLPTLSEHGVRRGVRRPESERSREEQEEQRDREEECGDEPAEREQPPQQRLEEHFVLTGLPVRVNGLAAWVPRERLAGLANLPRRRRSP